MADIEVIQRIVLEKGYRLTGHASVEAMKDGISPADIRHAIFHGKIIEEYPERDYPDIETVLIYAKLPANIPAHVVVDVIVEQSVIVVTAYVPDRTRWVASQKRKKVNADEMYQML
ncbi:MAG: DUF4258 domain-containing protein [Chloroflexi bacterium]|nr:DUF4258 domain-containing protein [Chloroflexota bacterium]